MAIYVPNASETNLMKLILCGAAQEDFLLKLHTDSAAYTTTDVAGTRTEATFTGYSTTANGTANKLLRATWNAQTPTGGQPMYYTWPSAIVFTSSAGSQNQSVYGYYIVGATSGLLYWQEIFTGGPFVIVNNGDSISVTPKFGLQ